MTATEVQCSCGAPATTERVVMGVTYHNCDACEAKINRGLARQRKRWDRAAADAVRAQTGYAQRSGR